MMNILVWHQTFSNYHNISFSPNNKVEKIRIKQNFSGRRIRLELTNHYDNEPLIVNSIKVSLHGNFTEGIYVTSNDDSSFMIPSKSSLWTDFVDFKIPKAHDIFIELSVQNKSNRLATSCNLLSKKLVTTNIEKEITFIYGVTSVELDSQEKSSLTIAFFGDSLTNQGYFSDVVLDNLFKIDRTITGFNAGISGNRLLSKETSDSKWRDSFGKPAVERYHEDVILYRPDIVIGLIGINDLFQPKIEKSLTYIPNVEEMICAFQFLFEQSKKYNIRYIPLTITPFANSLTQNTESWNHDKEKIRKEVNNWLKKQKNTIDIASFLEDKEDSTKLDTHFDCGDHLHFSKKGGEVLGLHLVDQITPLILEYIV